MAPENKEKNTVHLYVYDMIRHDIIQQSRHPPMCCLLFIRPSASALASNSLYTILHLYTAVHIRSIQQYLYTVPTAIQYRVYNTALHFSRARVFTDLILIVDILYVVFFSYVFLPFATSFVNPTIYCCVSGATRNWPKRQPLEPPPAPPPLPPPDPSQNGRRRYRRHL